MRAKAPCRVPLAVLRATLPAFFFALACGDSKPSSSSPASGGSSTAGSAGSQAARAGTSAGASATSGGGESSGGRASVAGESGTGAGGIMGASGAPVNSDPADDGLIGWATRHPDGAPTGGSRPIGDRPVMRCTATNMKTLRDCLFRAKKSDKSNTDTRPMPPDWASWEVHGGVTGGWKNYPLTIYVKGVIVASENDLGRAMGQADYEAGDPLCGTSVGAACQQAVIQAKLERGDISVIGIPGDGGEVPTLDGGWLMFRGQTNVVVRNLRIVNATDFWAKLESCEANVPDPDYCSYNAEPDGLTLDNTARVWIDHCEFTDGAEFDGVNPDKARYKMYDGLMDIKNGSDFVSLSYNRFFNHNKAMLIGATDSPDGNYGVTFHHNLVSFVQQRTPRVRNGQVHVLNNYYVGPLKTAYIEQYHFGYALGLGFLSQIYSEGNVFDIPGATPSSLLSANFDEWAQQFTDVGSWLDGQPVDLNAAAADVINARNAAQAGSTPFLGKANWTPTSQYAYVADTSADAVRDKVLARAGVGKVSPEPTL